MSARTAGDLKRMMVKPRVLIIIPILIASFLLYLTSVHRQNDFSQDKDDSALLEFELFRKARKSFDGSTDASMKLLIAEQLYQKHIYMRRQYINKNLNSGAWLPKAKEMMPFWWYFQPAFNCPYEVERVGSLNDGGKWMCGMSVLENMSKEDKCVIYSLGVFDDSSWEKEMIDRTRCQVYAFDASVNGIAGDAAGHPDIHFFKYFIGSKDEVDKDGYTWKTLKTAMEENGHTWIDVLKIDIEGNEFATLNSMMDQFEVLPFSQLQLEVHTFDEMEDRGNFMKFLKFWEDLESKSLRPFWSELNIVYSRMYKEHGLSGYSFINIADKQRFLPDVE